MPRLTIHSRIRSQASEQPKLCRKAARFSVLTLVLSGFIPVGAVGGRNEAFSSVAQPAPKVVSVDDRLLFCHNLSQELRSKAAGCRSFIAQKKGNTCVVNYWLADGRSGSMSIEQAESLAGECDQRASIIEAQAPALRTLEHRIAAELEFIRQIGIEKRNTTTDLERWDELSDKARDELKDKTLDALVNASISGVAAAIQAAGGLSRLKAQKIIQMLEKAHIDDERLMKFLRRIARMPNRHEAMQEASKLPELLRLVKDDASIWKGEKWESVATALGMVAGFAAGDPRVGLLLTGIEMAAYIVSDGMTMIVSSYNVKTLKNLEEAEIRKALEHASLLKGHIARHKRELSALPVCKIL